MSSCRATNANTSVADTVCGKRLGHDGEHSDPRQPYLGWGSWPEYRAAARALARKAG